MIVYSNNVYNNDTIIIIIKDPEIEEKGGRKTSVMNKRNFNLFRAEVHPSHEKKVHIFIYIILPLFISHL